jgi:hypothetical protein
MMKKILSNRKFMVPVVLMALLMLALLVVQLIASSRAVYASLKEMNLTKENSFTGGWNDDEIRKLKKDILWFEQLLALARHDSISLVIDLNDSVVQISLKGMDLLQTKVLKHYPANFLASAGEATWMHYGKINPIRNEVAGIPKRQVKKIVAFTSSDDASVHSDDQSDEKPLHWKFTTAGNLGVVITGVQISADSSYILQSKKDLLKYRMNEFLKEPFPTSYTPTLYLWLDDRDAKAIYKAVSSKGNVLFRN